MDIGIFGSAQDPQCAALAQSLQSKGIQPGIIDSLSLSRGGDVSFEHGRFRYQGQDLMHFRAWYMRYVVSPLPPAFEHDQQYYLFRDWYLEYMHRREQFGFELSTLLAISYNGIPVVNPPEHGSVAQLKAFQLAAAISLGLDVPRTLITNEPGQVKEFAEQVEQVVYKPGMGGALCRLLDEQALAALGELPRSPVIFQERVPGDFIRLTMVADRPVSCVRIPTDAIDYRADPGYIAGRQDYQPIQLEQKIVEQCYEWMKACGLLFTGVDLVMRPDGSCAFLEANSSPAYLEIEQKTRVPITDTLAGYLILLANDPDHYREALSRAQRPRSFIKYASPFRPDREL